MKAVSLFEELRGNSYPGRGIVLGLNADGKNAVAAYFIMGRSVNSRNRIFQTEGENMRTKAFDPAKLADPSLVIYFPVRVCGDSVIVTNGDQTDTIDEYLRAGKTFEEALRARTFEPDAPNYTPRISGIMDFAGGYGYKLSILKSADGCPDAALRFFYEYQPMAGVGHFIHTYRCDGEPIPSFEGEPTPVALEGDVDSFTQALWDSLNEDNRVSLFVRYVDVSTGRTETRIVNKNS